MRYYYRNRDWWHIGFRYDPRLVKEAKAFANSCYNPENREWLVPVHITTSAQIKKWLNDNNFTEQMVYTPSERVLSYQEPPVLVHPEDVAEACRELGLTRQPRPYQCEGIAYMLNHGNCINGDSCGLGKTGQSITAVELMGAFPALVICPASVKYNWKKEWAKWNPNRTVGVVERKGKMTPEVWENDVVVINFDVLGTPGMEKPKAKFQELLKKKWQACIIDEIHFLKNGKSLRTKMAKKVTRNTPYIWGLTGTLTQNRPSELIEPYRILRRFDEVFGGSLEFKYRYCDGKYTRFGFDASGFSNLEELHVLLKMAGYVRREKREVLDELPPLIEETIDMPISNEREYRKAERDLLAYLETIDIEKANSAANAPHLVMINTLRQLSIKGKMEAIKGYIRDWLDANGNSSLLVFGVHREPLQELADYFEAPVIQGGVTPEKKQKIVNSFSAGEHRLLFANIQSAGTGTDGLQENCSDIAYIELPDKSTDITQTNSRLERMGQKNTINVTYLMCPDTIDAVMMDTIESKRLLTGVVNAGESEAELLARNFYLKHSGNR